MTGAYVRIERDGAWVNAELDTLSDAELEALAVAQGAAQGWVWLAFLARWVLARVDGLGEEERQSLQGFLVLEEHTNLTDPEQAAEGWRLTTRLVRWMWASVRQAEAR